MVDRVESDEQKEKLLIIGKTISANKAISSAISYLSSSSDRPFVLLIDEIDALVGDTLISVLRQIRASYDKRPENFPISIVLCGVRDIITGGSAFNINAESLRLGNFTKVDVKNLLLKHTTETGQIFEDAAIDQIFNEIDGQP